MGSIDRNPSPRYQGNWDIAEILVEGQFDVAAARGPHVASPKARLRVPATRRYNKLTL